ncbi:primosomal protein N' [Anaerococcus hydrogenalis]|uniref:Replication restart protein PriA n=1 Tax=Anaerococcus hydrogenalis TaxID=33029 RepID=A0A2N6ULA1_9FIRM|nr:primosomal protein N' [Anaerococcus hydrogenalis]MDK7694562.1 primosomal protein N' [Anaerococcus hydrogenalis]MDK7696340.1 primosomal protein N' [Anaerococcus hydrogenalis]MDK7707589.1 primosomal protein N' [Anaerococcus hydrogenalis]PMC82601.1 primosomal protein N' [Anaerococcus hydrogenalis]
MYCLVILDNKSRFLDQSFTYHVPEKFENKIQKGMRVIVPFGKGNKNTIAFVYDLVENLTTEFKTKDILEIVDSKALVDEELIDLAFYMNRRYLSPLRSCVRQILPPGKIDKIKEYYYPSKNLKKDDEFYEVFKNKITKKEILNKYNIEEDLLNQYKKNGLIKTSFDINSNQKINYTYIFNLKKEYDDKKLPSNAKKQKEILNYLKYHKDVEYKELLKNTKSSKNSLDSLIEKDLLEIKKIEINKQIIGKVKYYKKPILTDEQNKIIKKIMDQPNKSYLLKGVTGSGKTEVFLQIVEENLKNGKDSIILVPEISLTPQTIERFQGRFNQKIAILHSRLTQKEKFQQWRMIKNGDVKIVVGARSAIFAPFKNLGAIIIDEEHDKSYISSQDPKFHTDELALFRQKYNKATLIFASATPSIKTMTKALNVQYDLVELKNRVNGKMPKVEIVDMREELKKSNYSMISSSLYDKILEKLKNKEQIILFLNKIGHNSFTFCRNCGYVVKCEACDVAMTYHKNVSKLVCHYCGRTKNQPRVCPVCGSSKIKEFGAGTEKLEEEVKNLFPEANIIRMDSMTSKDKSSYDNMYKLMKEKKVDILIGTQMIAKGLDFENVTLVGIISADLSLNIDDYTAYETSFELITQVSGRAGRSKKQGQVIIQTYKPDNFVINAASKNDYQSFYNYEIQARKAFEYPPFVNLITIKILDKSRIKCIDISKKIKYYLDLEYKENVRLKIIGPNPCKISRINNKYRYNIIIKLKDSQLEEVSSFLTRLRKYFINRNKDTSIIIALNPSDIN